MDPSQLNLPPTSSSSTSSNGPEFGTQVIGPATKRRREQAGAKIRMVSGPSSRPCARAAIVLDKLPGLDLARYVSGVENAVRGATEVQWVDELHPSQVCLFLADRALAESQHGRYLDIDGHRLRARPLTRVPLVRVLATNALPLLSNEEIASILLDRHGIEVKDSVYLEAAASGNGLLSFARYLYVEPQDVAKFPAKIHGEHNKWQYTIYFGSEEQWCDGCQRLGHSEWNCDEEHLPKYIGLDQTKTIVLPSTKNDDITAPLPSPPTPPEQSGGVVPTIDSTSTSETANNGSDTRLNQRKASPLNVSEQGNSSNGNSSTTQMQSSLAKPKITVYSVSRSNCPQQTYIIRAVKLLPKEQQKR